MDFCVSPTPAETPVPSRPAATAAPKPSVSPSPTPANTPAPETPVPEQAVSTVLDQYYANDMFMAEMLINDDVIISEQASSLMFTTPEQHAAIDGYEVYSDPGDGYDEWSDPGGYYDDGYEAYSDPGDGYDEWSDPGDYYDY